MKTKIFLTGCYLLDIGCALAAIHVWGYNRIVVGLALATMLMNTILFIRWAKNA
jgi:hypothetical protein